MDLGGPVMWALLGASILLWTLILERYWFLYYSYPKLLHFWSGHAKTKRARTIAHAETLLSLRRYLHLIKTLSGILPMLGLLGTVTGIVETFDLIRVFGSSELRIIARGISQALITTLAGLVMGLFGVGAGYDLNRRTTRFETLAYEHLQP